MRAYAWESSRAKCSAPNLVKYATTTRANFLAGGGLEKQKQEERWYHCLLFLCFDGPLAPFIVLLYALTCHRASLALVPSAMWRSR